MGNTNTLERLSVCPCGGNWRIVSYLNWAPLRWRQTSSRGFGWYGEWLTPAGRSDRNLLRLIGQDTGNTDTVLPRMAIGFMYSRFGCHARNPRRRTPNDLQRRAESTRHPTPTCRSSLLIGLAVCLRRRSVRCFSRLLGSELKSLRWALPSTRTGSVIRPQPPVALAGFNWHLGN